MVSFLAGAADPDRPRKPGPIAVHRSPLKPKIMLKPKFVQVQD
jgi:hypothetical protein